MTATQKVTYATTDPAALEAIDRAFEAALPQVRASLGQRLPMYVSRTTSSNFSASRAVPSW